MVARRKVLGWLALGPAALALSRCIQTNEGDTALDVTDTTADTPDLADLADTNDTPDTNDAPDLADLAEDTAPDTADLPDVPRVCAPTQPDALGPFYEEDAPNTTNLSGTLPGSPLAMSGQVKDTDCRPIAGALVEVWQADEDGDYHDELLRASLTADADGRFAFTTIMPGRYLQATGLRPAHLHYRVSAPGFRTLVTQIYFEGDPYLRPNDSCRTCGSGDSERIVPLTRNGDRDEGACDITLSR
jgi:protocatechuate 3,4-dioxygenase beta subunit